MTRNTGYRSNVVRLSVGGALAVGLGAASSAWACTPQASFLVRDVSGATVGAPGAEVMLTAERLTPPEGMTLSLAQVSGPRIAGVRADGPVIALGSMTVTKEMADAKATAKLSATVRPDTLGYYYFEMVATYDGIEVGPRTESYRVVAPASASTQPEVVGENPAAPIDNPVVAPLPDGNQAPVVAPRPEANPAPVVAGQPAAAPAAVATKAPVRTPAPQTAATPSAAPAAAPRATAAVPVATPAVVAPSVATPLTALAPSKQVAPPASDLWSGIDASKPSLLDTPASAQPAHGLPIGAGLLGIGTLVLTGIGAFAGKRRLALVRRIRS